MIFRALGIQGISPNKKPKQINTNLFDNNVAYVVSNNESNINLFEAFAAEKRNTNLINNELLANNNQSQAATGNIDLFNNNKANNNSSYNLNSIRNNGIDLFNSLSNNAANKAVYHNLFNNSSNNNERSNSNKAFSFIKNKNSYSNNHILKVQNENDDSLFNNLNIVASFQSHQANNNNTKTNPNDFSDLFDSLKLNGTNKNNENKPEIPIIINNLNSSQQEENKLISTNSNKKGFSFIKKDNKQSNSNGNFHLKFKN